MNHQLPQLRSEVTHRYRTMPVGPHGLLTDVHSGYLSNIELGRFVLIFYSLTS